MKRPKRFIIGILAAGITFATLTATVGTEHWKRRHFQHGYYHHDHNNHHDHDSQDQKRNNDSESDGDEPVTE